MTLQESLIEIFKAVADAVDGNDDLPDDVREAYNEAWNNPLVQDLYRRLIEKRHYEAFWKI